MYCETTITKLLWCFTFIVLVVLLILQTIDIHTVVKNHESASDRFDTEKQEESIKIPVNGNDKYELSFNGEEIELTPIAG